MENKSFRAALKKNAMLIVLVLVYLFFLILTQGGIFKPSSFTELINQNAYVYILGAGMLMCMLTGGNIDLSCGAFVCLLGIVGAYLIYIAYELWQDWGNTETTMTTPARVIFMVLFVLCGAALLVYAVIVWRRAVDQKEEDDKPPEDENSLK